MYPGEDKVDDSLPRGQGEVEVNTSRGREEAQGHGRESQGSRGLGGLSSLAIKAWKMEVAKLKEKLQ